MNSIINQNSGDNNSISSLNFKWLAIFKDSSKIEQFENGIENKFQLVLDRMNELAYFNLKDDKGHLFIVNLLNGLIGYNTLEFPYIELKETKENIRLIYFRRHRIIIGTSDLTEKENSIKYHLGIQYLDKYLNNRKIILIIDNEGNWVIEE
jgi:hypothetical protein